MSRPRSSDDASTRPGRSRLPATVAVLALVAVAGIALVGPALAAENLHAGSATPSQVNESEKVGHTFTYEVDNVSKDGNTDRLYLEFPDSVNASANALSSFSGNVTNANTGASVSISSSVSIVDGPDGDGVQETVTVGVQPEGQNDSVDLLVQFTGDVTWPAVDGDTTLPIDAAVTDSKFPNAGPAQVTSVTVKDTDDSGSASLSVAIDSVTEPVVEGESVDVSATVTNDGSASGSQTIDLTVDGRTVDSQSVSLGSGESTTVSLSWPTGTDDAGDHQLTVASANDSASTTATVQEPASLAVSIDSADSTVTEGETVDVSATVTNEGDVTTSQSVRLLVDDSEVAATTVSVAGGSSTTVSLSWETTSGDAGDYGLTVATEDDAASAAVTVEADVDPTVGIANGSAVPGVVNESVATSHVFTYRVRNASNDGNGNALYLTFPNEVNASTGALSSFGGNVTDLGTGASVSISSSAAIVDGPDSDGVRETVRVGVQPEGQRATRELLVKFRGAVTWPAVDGDRSYPVRAAVKDSAYPGGQLTAIDEVTVLDTTGDGTANEDTPTETPTETVTDQGTTATDGETPANGTATTTAADGPGFGVFAALAALAGLLLARLR